MQRKNENECRKRKRSTKEGLEKKTWVKKFKENKEISKTKIEWNWNKEIEKEINEWESKCPKVKKTKFKGKRKIKIKNGKI